MNDELQRSTISDSISKKQVFLIVSDLWGLPFFKMATMKFPTTTIIMPPKHDVTDAHQFEGNLRFTDTLAHVQENDSMMHIQGIGGIDGIKKHHQKIKSILKFILEKGIQKIVIHISEFAEQADIQALDYLIELEKIAEDVGIPSIITASGRLYALKRKGTEQNKHEVVLYLDDTSKGYMPKPNDGIFIFGTNISELKKSDNGFLTKAENETISIITEGDYDVMIKDSLDPLFEISTIASRTIQAVRDLQGSVSLIDATQVDPSEIYYFNKVSFNAEAENQIHLPKGSSLEKEKKELVKRIVQIKDRVQSEIEDNISCIALNMIFSHIPFFKTDQKLFNDISKEIETLLIDVLKEMQQKNIVPCLLNYNEEDNISSFSILDQNLSLLSVGEVVHIKDTLLDILGYSVSDHVHHSLIVK